jgi:DNA repair exonuclease SbcCD ATPase subunit
MADRDFFDEDLVQNRDEVKRIKMGPGDQPARQAAVDPMGYSPPGAGSELNLTRMVRRREEVTNEVARQTQELEKLRHRQEDIERQRRDLEELRQRQDEYTRGKKDMLERLTQSIISLEKQEVRAAQLADLLGATRGRFKQMYAEIGALDEESWSEEGFREELSRALAMVDDARMEFNKTMARVESASGTDEAIPSTPGPAPYPEAPAEPEEDRGFGYWLKVGLAVSLPIVLALLVLFGALLWMLFRSGYIG